MANVGNDEGAARRRALRTADDGTPGFNYRTIVAPDVKVMCMTLNKNACTSIKWMMAGLCGEDLESFEPMLQPHVTMQDSVHNRALWRVTPKLSELDPELRASIHPENGWFVFAVVRDPRIRLFSAWQNKLLLDHPGYAVYRDEPWYPRHPVTVESIVEDFERFVCLIEQHPDSAIRSDDHHFRDQTELLMLDTFSYSHIYDISEIGQLPTDLNQHLEGVGADKEVKLPQLNDTPLRPHARVFSGGIKERVEAVYKEDFSAFSSRWDFSIVEREPDWEASALNEVEIRAQFGRRLTYMRAKALEVREDLQRARRKIRGLRNKIARLEGAKRP